MSKKAEPIASNEPAAQWLPVASLTAWARNPRLNDGQPVRKVADSIKRFGWGAVVLARRDGLEVVAGHTRLKAVDALATEYKAATERERATWHPEAVRVATQREVPVRLGDWSEHDAHLLALADNRIGELAEWDVPALQDILSGFDLPDVDLAGWDAAALDEMASGLARDGSVNDAEAEWEGMEPFENPANKPFRSIVIHFDDQESVDDFSASIGQPFTTKTKYIWHPHKPHERAPMER